MNVLVTGSAGYIGSRLVNYLMETTTSHFICVDNLLFDQYEVATANIGHPQYEFHNENIKGVNFLRLVRRADIIIHLAALVGAPYCKSVSDALVTSINRDATVRLVRGLSINQKLIYCCTNSGYGTSQEEVKEDTPMKPLSSYGQTKVLAEQEVLAHPLGVSLRLATVFGASPRMRMDLLLNDFTGKIMSSKTIDLYEGEAHRNAVHIGDVVRAIDFAMEKLYNGPYNVASYNMTKKEFAHKVCDRLGASRDLIVDVAGSDIDKRNCKVSSDKIKEKGFIFEGVLEKGIDEVADICEVVPDCVRSLWINA